MTSIKTTARIAGLLYLLQIPLGVFGVVYVPKALMVTGNTAATAFNIQANEFLFRLSIVSAILCALVTVATALYIYKVLRYVNVFRSTYIPGVIGVFRVLWLLIKGVNLEKFEKWNKESVKSSILFQ